MKTAIKLFARKILILCNNFWCNLFPVDDMRKEIVREKFDVDLILPERHYKGKNEFYHYNPDYKAAWIDVFEKGITIPDVWYIHFPKVYLIGKGLMISKNKRIFLESAFFQREYINKLRVGHLIFKNLFFRPSIRLSHIIPLMNRLSNNYSHWTIDNLTRIALFLKQDPTARHQYHLAINHNAPAYVTDSLVHLIGWPSERIIRFKNNDVAEVSDCIFISYPVQRDASTLMTYAYPNEIYQVLNQYAVTNIHLTGNQLPTNFIISRAKSIERNLVNEQVLVDKFRDINMEIVQLEDLNFVEQVQLFQNARLIIAAHGAGLTNTLYCNKNAFVFELFPIGRSIHQTSSFSQISRAIGFHLHLIMIEPINEKEDMIVNDELVKKIKKISGQYKQETLSA